MKKFISTLLVFSVTLLSFSGLQCFADENEVNNEVVFALAELEKTLAEDAYYAEQIEVDAVKPEESTDKVTSIVIANKEKVSDKATKKSSWSFSGALNYIKENKWWFIVPALLGIAQGVLLFSDRTIGTLSKYIFKTANLSDEVSGKYINLMRDICKDPLKRGRFEDFMGIARKLKLNMGTALSLYPAYDSFRNKPKDFYTAVASGCAAGAAVGTAGGMAGQGVGCATGGTVMALLQILAS